MRLADANKRKQLTTVRRQQNELLSTLDGYLTALENQSAEQTQTFAFGDNPFVYLIQLLEHLGCTREEMIEKIAKIIIYGLPAIEIGVKGILLSNMKNLVACAVDPRIPNYAREKGMTYNIKEIDPLGILSTSPLDKYNQLYFGTDNMKTPYDFVRPVDMNTFLWFVVHKGKYPNSSVIAVNEDYSDFFKRKYGARTVSGSNINTVSYLTFDTEGRNQGMALGSTFIQRFTNEEGTNGHLISLCTNVKFIIKEKQGLNDYYVAESTIMPIGNAWDRTNYYVNRGMYLSNLGEVFDKKNENNRDYNKDIGLCSFQFLDSLKNYDAYNVSDFNEPYNCLNVRVLPKPLVHVPHIGQTFFFPLIIRYNSEGKVDKDGRFSVMPVREMPTDTMCHTNVKTIIIEKLLEKLGRQPTQEEQDEVYFTLNDKNNDSKSDFFSMDGAIWWYKLAFFETQRTATNYKLVIDHKGNYKITSDNLDVFTRYNFDEITEVNSSTTLSLIRECYFGLTLYEFNYDYIMSQRLFDSKVVATQLINVLADFMIGGSITFSQTEIEGMDRIYHIVEKIVNSDGYEASDCFYTFSNDEVERMSRDAELKRARLTPFGDCERRVDTNTDEVIEALNDFGSATEFQEQKDAFSRVVRNVSAVIDREAKDPDVIDSVSFDFITNMFQSLSVVIVTALLSPKVLLMILINQELCGNYSHESWKKMTLENILYAMHSMIAAIILEIRDLLLKELLEEVRNRINALLFDLQVGLIREQIEVYRRAIKLMIKACSFKGGSNLDLDTVLDKVDYADIDELQHQTNETSKC